MLLINWLELQPLLADLDALNERLQEALPVRKVCQLLAEITLRGYPWSGRSDLIPIYQPSRTYKPGQWIALPVTDPQKRRPTAWQVAHVKAAEITGNPVQGRFQALTLDVQGKEVHLAGGILETDCSQPELSGFTAEELGWLGEWISEAYFTPLRSTLRKLIQKGRVCGQLEGETFFPEQMFTLPAERLRPFFTGLSSAQRWLSIEQVLQGLPELSDLRRETALALIRTSLKVSPYRPLGGDRWTTPELFDQLDREVPLGLPDPHLRSQTPFWSRQDKQDLARYQRKPMPAEASRALEELGLETERPGPGTAPWQPPEEPVRLPALSYFHVTQGYFPVGRVLHALAPEARMVFVQWIEGDHLPFLLDREHGLLKAIHFESLRDKILENGIPAGTYLWLEYQGGEKYRLYPQPLPAGRMVPGRTARLENGELHIEAAQIQMDYEGELPLFLADAHAEEIDDLYAGAGLAVLGVREAVTQAMQQICAVDPQRRAHRSEVFNAVALMRRCSPHAVAALLYNQPCFEQIEDGYFRYTPVPHPAGIALRERANLARLWEALIAERIPAEPPPFERRTYVESQSPAVSNQGAPHPFSFPQNNEENRDGEGTFMGKELHASREEVDLMGAPLNRTPMQHPSWDDHLETSSRGLEGMGDHGWSARSEEAGAGPKSIRVEVGALPDQGPASVIDTRRMAYGLKIPARPLHKRPVYQRLLFCLRGWLSMIGGSSREQYTR